MARSLANIINKGIFAFPAARSTSSKSLYQSIIGFSTHVPNDPDTHQNLLPSNNVENSEPTMKEFVEKEVKENKGTIDYCDLITEYLREIRDGECRKRPVGALMDFERDKNKTIDFSDPSRFSRRQLLDMEASSRVYKQRTYGWSVEWSDIELEELNLRVKKLQAWKDYYEGHCERMSSKKDEESKLTVKEIVEKDMKEISVMVYMNGTPLSPLCLSSRLVAKILQTYRVVYDCRNVWEKHGLKQAVKDISGWPTFPQVFIMGEFIGGANSLFEMHENGELKKKLNDPKFKAHYYKYPYGTVLPFYYDLED